MLHVSVSEVEEAIKDHVKVIEEGMPTRIRKLSDLLWADLVEGPVYVNENLDPVHLQYSEFAPRPYYQDTEGETRSMGEDPEIDSFIEGIGMDPGEEYKSDVPVPFDFRSATSEVSDWMRENVHDVYVTEFGSLYTSEDALLKDELESTWDIAQDEGLTRDEFEEQVETRGWEPTPYYLVEARDIMKEIVGTEVLKYL